MKNREQQGSGNGPGTWQRSERSARGTAIRMREQPQVLGATAEQRWSLERIRTELMDAELWCLCAIGLILFIAH